ncbi:MAG: glycosyltransferase, partial [Candidatus Altiarchaeota archaeon]|nr:glycosyltransferase [Candidatus Altiarchaeota archaeon]
MKALRKWYPIDEYPQRVKDLNIDIALAPLRDSDFNRAKSNLRWLEYSALKIPTVASNVEPFRCIEDQKTGLLVTEPGEWENAISELIEDQSKRKMIGENAYHEVKKNFNVEKIAA